MPPCVGRLEDDQLSEHRAAFAELTDHRMVSGQVGPGLEGIRCFNDRGLGKLNGSFERRPSLLGLGAKGVGVGQVAPYLVIRLVDFEGGLVDADGVGESSPLLLV